MKYIFLLFICIFPNTNSLTCFVRCGAVKTSLTAPFSEPTNELKCLNDTQATNCYGQILTYHARDHQSAYLLYSIGPRKHIIEKAIEDLAERHQWRMIIYFLFVIESFQTDEVVISTHILCRTKDNCALNYVRSLFNSYQQKASPASELKQLLYNSQERSTLMCYNSETTHVEECSTSEHATCLINNTDILQQKCCSDSNTKLEFGFLITSLQKNSITKKSQFYVCNVTGCNDKLVLKQVEAIIYNYTLSGLNMTFNRSDQEKFDLFDLIYLLMLKAILL